MLNFCTMSDYNYITQYLSLCESIAANHDAYHIYTLASCQKSLSTLKRLKLPNVTLISLSEIDTDALRALRKRIRHAEYVWALKPSFIQRVLRDVDRVMYVDADGYFFNTAQIILKCVGNAPLGVTPHRFTPKYRCYIKNGEFNAGFIYVKRCKQTMDCLKSWNDCCVSTNRKGRMVEQLHLNAWPSEYDAHVIGHKGINLAPWNQKQYSYSIKHGKFFVGTDPIVLYHFHQGLKTAYPMHEFLQARVYPIYRDALKRAKKRVQ